MAPLMWLGRPGGRAYSLARMPARGYARGASAHAGQHATLGGSYGVDRAPRECRTWSLDWRALSDPERRDLAALYSRQYGPGPYYLLDPGCRNHLTPAQASGTSSTCDTSGFSAAGGETLASSEAQTYRTSRSLAWSLPASVSSGILTLGGPPGLDAWPTPEGETWTFAALARVSGSDTSVGVSPALRWLDAALAQVSESVGTQVTLGSSGWSQLEVTAEVPAGACYLVPRGKAAAGTVSATTTVHLTDLQLERAPARGLWMPGEGLPLVSITSLPESVPWLDVRDLQATLVEVG